MTAATRSYRWLFWTLALMGLTIDQISKYELFSHLYNSGHGDSIVLWSGYFNVDVARFGEHWVDDGGLVYKLRTYGGCLRQPHVNKGALFGLGHGQNLAFAVVSVVAAAFIIGWSLREAASRDWFLCMALGLILAGTLGNLYDRIVFEGVRDFLHWFKWYDWPVFNVADICLVSGAGLLLLEAFFRKQPDEQADGQVAVSSANP